MEYEKTLLLLMERVLTLENEVQELKRNLENRNNNLFGEQKFDDDQKNESKVRDTTKYIYDGTKYAKNGLVLAIVKNYVNENPEISFEELEDKFPKNLQGSIGVVKRSEEIDKYKDPKKRFFAETVICGGEHIYICSQWSADNIDRFLQHARNLGYVIIEVK